MPSPGESAPEFTLPNATGAPVTLSSFRGKKVVLYFYPKDMTPGCTQQACDLRDRYDRLQQTGAVLLGVSPDSSKRHTTFAQKYELPFTLLADENTEVATAYGVWKEKSLYGRKFMGVERTTFLIDEQGNIAKVWPRVKVAGHGDEVLAALGAE
jgi:peroxiredoxin Q/BCP